MNYQINESELLSNRVSIDNKTSYNNDQVFSKTKDGMKDFNTMKNFKYSYPGSSNVEGKESVVKSKPKGIESRFSEDVLVTNKANNPEKLTSYTLASDREYPKTQSKKPSYEEIAKQYLQEARKPENPKATGPTEAAPGSISEIVDTNKVKTSKLFQKFLQNENKENPKKANQNDKSRQSLSPERQQPKEQNKSKTPPPAMAKNPASRQEKVPKQQEKNPNLKERNIPNLDLMEGSMQYVKGSSTSRSPRQQQDNNYDEELDSKNQGINLNYHSSSKLVAMQMSEFPASVNSLQNVSQSMPYQAPNLYSFLEYDEKMKQQQQKQNQAQANNTNEIMMQRSQILELSQTLTREVEAKKALENKCEELQSQLEKMAQISQNSKNTTLSRETEYQEIAFKAEDKVRSLNETLIEKAKQEDQYLAEINKLKRKLDLELESRGRLLEEHDELERSKYEEAERLNAEIKYKEEEIQRLKRDHDASKHDKDSFRAVEERQVREIKGLKSEIIELNRVIDDLRKNCDDKQQQINLGQIENSSLRDQLDAMESQYRDLLAENDKVKRDNFGLKERLLSAESEIKTLQLSLDKAEIDANQTAEALSRTEKALEKERKLTSELKAQVSTEMRHNQWEAPPSYERRDRSSNRPYTASTTLTSSNQYEEDNDKPYYRRSNTAKETTQQDSFQPTKYDQKHRDRSQTTRYDQKQQQDDFQQTKYDKKQDTLQATKYDQKPQDTFQATKYDRKLQDNSQTTRYGQKQQQDSFQPTKYEQKNEPKQKHTVSFDENDTYSQNARRGNSRWGSQQQQQQPTYEEPKPRESYGRESFKQGRADESIYTRMGRRTEDRVETNVQAPSENKYEERFRRGRETSKSHADNTQNEYEQAKSKTTTQNQFYRPSQNPVTWQGDTNDNKAGQNRAREYQSPPRGTSQERPERGSGKRHSPPPAKNQNFMREDIPEPNAPKVHALEMELMNLQMKKDNLTNELQKLDKVKIKSGANIKKKQELEAEMDTLQGSISSVKTKLRELNALHI